MLHRLIGYLLPFLHLLHFGREGGFVPQGSPSQQHPQCSPFPLPHECSLLLRARCCTHLCFQGQKHCRKLSLLSQGVSLAHPTPQEVAVTSSARQVLTRPPASPPACNCSGRSEECSYDRELFRRSGHGGHCRNCRDNTAGPHCESCRQNYYRWEPQGACQPCHCHPAGAWGCSQPGSGCKTTAPAGVCWEGWFWWVLPCSGFPRLPRPVSLPCWG